MNELPKNNEIWCVNIPANGNNLLKKVRLLGDAEFCVLHANTRTRRMTCALVTGNLESEKSDFALPSGDYIHLARTFFFSDSAFVKKVRELTYDEAQAVHDKLVTIAR